MLQFPAPLPLFPPPWLCFPPQFISWDIDRATRAASGPMEDCWTNRDSVTYVGKTIGTFLSILRINTRRTKILFPVPSVAKHSHPPTAWGCTKAPITENWGMKWIDLCLFCWGMTTLFKIKLTEQNVSETHPGYLLHCSKSQSLSQLFIAPPTNWPLTGPTLKIFLLIINSSCLFCVCYAKALSCWITFSESQSPSFSSGLRTGADECPYCLKIISSGNVRRHIEDVHQPTHNPCDICGKVFSSANKLQSHKNYVHRKPRI